MKTQKATLNLSIAVFAILLLTASCGRVDDQPETIEDIVNNVPDEFKEEARKSLLTSTWDEEKLAQKESLNDSISYRDYSDLNLFHIPDVTEESYDAVKEWRMFGFALEGKITFEDHIQSNIRLTNSIDTHFDLAALTNVVDLNIGYAIAWSHNKGYDFGVEFLIPTNKLRVGEDEDGLIDNLFQSEPWKLLTEYLNGIDANHSFTPIQVLNQEGGRTEILFTGKKGDLNVDGLLVDVAVYFDYKYKVYWIEKIYFKGVDKLLSKYNPPVYFDASSISEIVDICKENLPIETNNEEYNIDVIPSTYYRCETENCVSVYNAILRSIYGNDAFSCIVDADKLAIIDFNKQLTQNSYVNAEIFQIPYTSSGNPNIIYDYPTAIPIPYAGITSTRNATSASYFTDYNGMFSYSCSTCYVRPSSKGLATRPSGFWNVLDDGSSNNCSWFSLGTWNSSTTPNQTFYFNRTSGYDNNQADSPWPTNFEDYPLVGSNPTHDYEFRRQFQAFYWLNWMHDTLSSYASVQYLSGGQTPVQWKYSICPTHAAGQTGGCGNAYGGGQINVAIADHICNTPVHPGIYSTLHEFGHGVDAVNTSAKGEGRNQGNNYCVHLGEAPVGDNYAQSHVYMRDEALARVNATAMMRYISYGSDFPEHEWDTGGTGTWWNHWETLSRSLNQLSWMIGWDNGARMLFGDDDGSGGTTQLRSKGDARCDTSKAYISGFAVPGSYEFTAADDPYCACWSSSRGTSCNSGSACSTLPPDITLRDHFYYQLVNKSRTYLRFEVDKAFYMNSNEACPSNTCIWEDDVTDQMWAAPMLERANSMGSSGSSNQYQLYWPPEPNSYVSYSTQGVTNFLGTKNHISTDIDWFSFSGEYGETYTINAYSWDGRDLFLMLYNEAGNSVAYNDNCPGGGVDPCITWTSSELNFYYLGVGDVNGQEGTYYLTYSMVGDDYPDYYPDSKPISVNDNTWVYGKMNSTSDVDVFRLYIKDSTTLQSNSLSVDFCTEQVGQTLEATLSYSARSSYGRWNSASPTQTTSGSTTCSTMTNVALSNARDAVHGANELKEGWYFLKIRRTAGTAGNYRINVKTNQANDSDYASEADPISICNDSSNPKAVCNDQTNTNCLMCLWDVMYDDIYKNYIYRHAGYLSSTDTEDWFEVDLPEGRRVSISVTGLRNTSGSSWVEPEIELHSIKSSLGGNGFYDDDFFEYNTCSIQDKGDHYILKDSGGGWKVYASGTGYGSANNSFLAFTVDRTQKYRIKIVRKSGDGPYQLTMNVHQSAINASYFPEYVP